MVEVELRSEESLAADRVEFTTSQFKTLTRFKLWATDHPKLVGEATGQLIIPISDPRI